MSNRPRHRLRTPTFRYGGPHAKLSRYARALTEKGLPEAEVARAVGYVQEYGFPALEGPPGTHTIFGPPTCGTPLCLTPAHQTVVFEPE